MDPKLDWPQVLRLEPRTGVVERGGVAGSRRLSGLAGLFSDREAERAAIAAGDPVVYDGMTAPIPMLEGHVGVATTRILPGSVGSEFYMTHGHVHVRPEGETYTCLSGRGGLLLRRGTSVVWIEMEPHFVGCIPPGWWHRTYNIGNEPFVFVAHYPRLSGHDYAPVIEHGMGARVFKSANAYAVVPDAGMRLDMDRGIGRHV